MTTTAAPAKELSMTPDAVRRRAKREADRITREAAQPADAQAKAKVVTSRKQPTAAPIKVSAAQKRTIGQAMASVASGFLPIASFVMAHYESKTNPLLWVLVAAALLFSAPTLADWAAKWCGNKYKAWGFTVLLEGVMVASHTEYLSFAGLIILVVINATNAWNLAARKVVAAE
jgi:VIT1/CCC1 family predicted Fe2+/Mn2+ transporter